MTLRLSASPTIPRLLDCLAAILLALCTLFSVSAHSESITATAPDGGKVEYRLDRLGRKQVLSEVSASGVRTYTTWENDSTKGVGPTVQAELCRALKERGQKRISQDADAIFVGYADCQCETLAETQTRCHLGTQARSKREMANLKPADKSPPENPLPPKPLGQKPAASKSEKAPLSLDAANQPRTPQGGQSPSQPDAVAKSTSRPSTSDKSPAATKNTDSQKVAQKKDKAGAVLQRIGDFEVIGDGSIVRDTRTKLEWMRCAYGRTWDGKICQGTATKVNIWRWKEYPFPNGWQVPTFKQLATLVDCGAGKPVSKSSGKVEYSICEGKFNKPTINIEAFPNFEDDLYLASSRNTFDNDYIDVLNFANGSLSGTKDSPYDRSLYPNASRPLILVRTAK